MVKQRSANDAAVAIFTGLETHSIALLLDVDGTLVDIGPSPAEVHVADALVVSLKRLFELTGGALALISGRPIADLDRLFSPLILPAVGGHGAEIRPRQGDAITSVAPLSAALRQRLAEAALPGSGILVEDKGYSLALHYRKAPQQEEGLRAHIAAARAAFSGEATEVLRGKAVFEVIRPGINKGDSVRELMTHQPFGGRVPVFIGDDVTDDAVFKVLPALGGKGFAVSRHFDGVAGIFESPEQVRSALQQLAAAGTAT